jgi:hypothetical protein
MVQVAQRRKRVDLDDDGPYDPEYPGQKVIADGGRVRVRLALTDAGFPQWYPHPHPRRVTDGYRLSDDEAARHRPHQAVLTDAQRARSESARDQWVASLRDAWRSPQGVPMGPGAPDYDKDDDNNGDDDLDPVERARQDYIRRVTNGWRSDPRDPAAAANKLEAMRRRVAHERMDAATLADRDAAYDEYVERISNAWRR